MVGYIRNLEHLLNIQNEEDDVLQAGTNPKKVLAFALHGWTCLIGLIITKGSTTYV